MFDVAFLLVLFRDGCLFVDAQCLWPNIFFNSVEGICITVIHMILIDQEWILTKHARMHRRSCGSRWDIHTVLARSGFFYFSYT